MALRDERRIVSWSLMAALSLVLAGCGGDSGTSSAATPQGTGAQTANQQERTPEPPTSQTPEKQHQAGTGQQDKAVADEGNAPPQIAQPGVVIENPIYAEPIAVPVPEGEGKKRGSDQADGDNRQPRDKPADDNEPEVAKPKPEPEPEEPDPVAQRPTLQWDSPLTREDGSKLYPGEISGYRVYYRLRHKKEFASVVVDGPGEQSLTLDDFRPGAYEFAVSTLDVNGMESRRSDPISVDLI
mgnify:CR=1 FL=1